MYVCVEEGAVIFVVVFLSGHVTNYVEVNKHFTTLKGKLQLSELNEVHEINSDKWGNP